MLAILTVDNNDLYRALYFVHLLAAIAAFGPLFLYPRLQSRRRDGRRSRRCTCASSFPALVVLWVAGMGMAGVGKIDLAGTPFITATIVLWLIALVVSWFLIRPALSDPDPAATKKMAHGRRHHPPDPDGGDVPDDLQAGRLLVQLISVHRTDHSAAPPMTSRPSSSNVAYGLYASSHRCPSRSAT